jgi:plasmid replication initiation protein
MSIKENYLVEKRNVLNEIRANNMTVQELRFFSIYLAKINSRDVSTRKVRFKVDEFRRVMDFGKMNIAQLRKTMDSLLGKIVEVPLESSGFMRFQLFKEAVFTKDNDGKWYIEVDAHDKALPLMFEFKELYFTYELWNALRLKSTNQFRMYEILKQYEHVGERTITLERLKEYIGMAPNEYPRYNNFKTRVLDACQEALAANTDIKFTYEPAQKVGKGGKVKSLKFTIERNEKYTDKLSLGEFLTKREMEAASLVKRRRAKEAWENTAKWDGSAGGFGEKAPQEADGSFFGSKVYPFLSEACGEEFCKDEIRVLYNYLTKIVPRTSNSNMWLLDTYDYLKAQYDELVWRSGKSEITNRFGYLRKMIEEDLPEKYKSYMA